jgi:colicin import membrane protein
VRGGLASSVVLHAAILAWALVTLQAQREPRLADEPIPVGIMTESEVTRLRQGARNAKQLEAQPKEAPKAEPAKKEAPKPTPAAAAPPPPPPPPKEEPKEEPKKEVASLPPPAPAPPPAELPPAPAPDEQKKLDELLKEQERQAEEQKKAEEHKKIEEQKRLEEERRQAELKKKLEEEKRRKEAELKKKREEEKKRKEAEAKKKEKSFDELMKEALLNKVPDKGAPRPSVPFDEQVKSLNKGPVLGAPEGRDQVLSASERNMLVQIIRQCVQSKWNVLAGGESAQNVQIKMRLRFNPDGTLAAPPQITNPQSTPFFLAVSDSALRAVQACEPYSLPPAKYEAWKDIIMTFDPRDMF